MNKKPRESSAAQIREVAKDFLNKNIRTPFQRKEIEAYVNKKLDVTSGSVTGALNSLLIQKGSENNIFQLERGLYKYDPDAIEQPTPSINEQLLNIMTSAFKEAEEVIASIQVVDYLDEQDLDNLVKFKELLNFRNQIYELLK